MVVDVDVIKAMASEEVEDSIKIQGGSRGGEVFGGFDGFVFGEAARGDEVLHHEMGLGRLILPQGGSGNGRIGEAAKMEGGTMKE